MVVVCEYCRQMVMVAAGFIQRHGVVYHGQLQVCEGSFKPYCSGCVI